jgi:hypothetical protein
MSDISKIITSEEPLLDVLKEECPYDMLPVDYSRFLREVQHGTRKSEIEVVVATRLLYGPIGGDIKLLPDGSRAIFKDGNRYL